MQAVRKVRKNNSPRMKRHTFLQKQGNIQKDKNRPDEKKGKKERKNAENEEGAKSQISEIALTMTRFFNSFRLNLTRKLKRNGWNRKNSIHPPNVFFRQSPFSTVKKNRIPLYCISHKRVHFSEISFRTCLIYWKEYHKTETKSAHCIRLDVSIQTTRQIKKMPKRFKTNA